MLDTFFAPYQIQIFNIYSIHNINETKSLAQGSKKIKYFFALVSIINAELSKWKDGGWLTMPNRSRQWENEQLPKLRGVLGYDISIPIIIIKVLVHLIRSIYN